MMIGQITDSILGQIQVHKKGYVASIDNLPLNLNLKKKAAAQVEESTAFFLQPFAPLLEPNPRSMKRLIIAYAIHRDLAVLSGLNVLDDLKRRKQLALWTILCLRWPALEEYLLQRVSDGTAEQTAVVKALLQTTAVAETWDRLDVLVNNAAAIQHLPLEQARLEVFDEHMSVNVRAPYFLTQAALPHLKASGSAAVINISSASGSLSIPGQSMYGMSKAALEYQTRSLAAELAPLGIRVNAIAPGPVDTPIHRV